MLKFLGSNLESFINLLLRVFLMSFVGSLWIEFDVCWDVFEVVGVCELWLFFIMRELIIVGVEEGKVIVFGVGILEDVVWDDEVVFVEEVELMKVLIVVCVVVVVVFFMVLLMVVWISDFIWVSWFLDSSFLFDLFWFMRFCICCCSWRNFCWSVVVVGIVLLLFWLVYVVILMILLFLVLFFVGFFWVFFRCFMSVVWVLVVERVSWLYRFWRFFIYRWLRLRLVGILIRLLVVMFCVWCEGGIIWDFCFFVFFL